jgi:hypothetical protein
VLSELAAAVGVADDVVLVSGVTSTGWNGRALPPDEGLGDAGWLVAGLSGSNGRLLLCEVGLADAVGVADVPDDADAAAALAAPAALATMPRRSVGPVAGCSSRGTSVTTGIGAVAGLT